MLWPVSTNISIITNFGCRANCWYCIWKGHELENINYPTDWNKLEKFICNNKEKGKVSVSGGGDCLYRFNDYISWWDILFKICNKYDMKIDIHTREKHIDCDFHKNINRVVFSSDNLLDDVDHFNYISKITKLRITHLVTDKTTVQNIKEYLHYQNITGCQFTIKQLVGFDDNGMYKKIRKEFPDIYCLDKGDYNIYYMPDNSIRNTFL